MRELHAVVVRHLLLKIQLFSSGASMLHTPELVPEKNTQLLLIDRQAGKVIMTQSV